MSEPAHQFEEDYLYRPAITATPDILYAVAAKVSPHVWLRRNDLMYSPGHLGVIVVKYDDNAMWYQVRDHYGHVNSSPVLAQKLLAQKAESE